MSDDSGCCAAFRPQERTSGYQGPGISPIDYFFEPASSCQVPREVATVDKPTRYVDVCNSTTCNSSVELAFVLYPKGKCSELKVDGYNGRWFDTLPQVKTRKLKADSENSCCAAFRPQARVLGETGPGISPIDYFFIQRLSCEVSTKDITNDKPVMDTALCNPATCGGEENYNFVLYPNKTCAELKIDGYNGSWFDALSRNSP